MWRGSWPRGHALSAGAARAPTGGLCGVTDVRDCHCLSPIVHFANNKRDHVGEYKIDHRDFERRADRRAAADVACRIVGA